jgi:hypothetical protein
VSFIHCKDSIKLKLKHWFYIPYFNIWQDSVELFLGLASVLPFWSALLVGSVDDVRDNLNKKRNGS